MKLLDKKTVNTVMAGERKSQIDEGVTLAKKIDALRQTLSSLQQQHQEFVNGMSEGLRKQTETLQFEIDSKRMVLCDLEEERMRLLEPLTNAWNDYKEKERELNISKEEYHQKRAYLTIYQQELDERQKKLIPEEDRLIDMAKQVQKQADKAVSSSIEAQKILSKAESYDETVRESLDVKKKELVKRETEIAVKERDIELEKNFIEKEKKDIIKIKAQLKDQRDTLERAMKRLKL